MTNEWFREKSRYLGGEGRLHSLSEGDSPSLSLPTSSTDAALDAPCGSGGLLAVRWGRGTRGSCWTVVSLWWFDSLFGGGLTPRLLTTAVRASNRVGNVW